MCTVASVSCHSSRMSSGQLSLVISTSVNLRGSSVSLWWNVVAKGVFTTETQRIHRDTQKTPLDFDDCAVLDSFCRRSHIMSTPRAVQKPRRYQLFIDGQFVDAESGNTFYSPNTATGETFAEVSEAEKADVDKAVS